MNVFTHVCEVIHQQCSM